MAYNKRQHFKKSFPNYIRLYGIMDCCGGDSHETLVRACRALEGGCRMIQLRDKDDIPVEDLLTCGRLVGHECQHYGGVMIMNDNVEAALELSDIYCDGVHLGQDDMSPTEARRILGDDMIIGVTAHNVDEALKAQADGADYLGVGDVFGSATKNDTTRITTDILREICHSVSIPVVAIGGINENNILSLKGTGIAGAAVSKAMFGMPLPQEFLDTESQFENHKDFEHWASYVRQNQILNATKNLYEKAKMLTSEDKK